MAKWTKYFRPVNSTLPTRDSSTNLGSSSIDKFSSFLPEVYQGPANRLQRYAQYDQMDMDHDVHAALNTMSEFSTRPDAEEEIPLSIKFRKEPTEHEVIILKKTLRQWCEINEFSKRMFRIFRSTLKYGDQVFIRDPETYKLIWIDPQTVERVIVNESQGKIPEIYYIKNLDLNLQTLSGTDVTKKSTGGYGSSDSIFPNAPLTGQANYTHGNAMPSQISTGSYSGSDVSFPVDAKHVIHMSLTEGMDDAWPFGISILEKVFKTYKQKELLEDSIIIYRVHRAPERRVFFIDTGTLPPSKAQQYLERVRYEVHQKRIPSRTGGGQNITDSAYNPMSMLEDYFFAQTADGRGSKVDILPGGENLGEVNDLKMWNNKLFRALGIPSSYLPTGPEDGTAAHNDGRIGAAFIQEFRFTTECKRLQNQLIDPLDLEFKMFLKHRDIEIDSSVFKLCFNEPQNFQEYRLIELQSAYASVFTQLADVPYISKRMLLKKYLGWNDQDILENEGLWKQEQGDETNTDDVDTDLRQVGVTPGGFDGFEGDDISEEDLDAEDIVDDEVDDVSDDEIDNFGETQ